TPTPTGACYDRADYDMLSAKNAIAAETLAPISGLTIVPVYDQNSAHPEWITADGHPNDLGHAFLAQTFLALMLPLLERCAGAAGDG
ncbi:MAG: SGNH/GDSL hydrolase family protein, partial [Deltaproteobacteria bacterium]|nr:SGNH/GDSL hydrolase family protein [Deltaproteobacteria bacterium]